MGGGTDHPHIVKGPSPGVNPKLLLGFFLLIQESWFMSPNSGSRPIGNFWGQGGSWDSGGTVVK